MEKSYVSIAQEVCFVTGNLYDSGEILIDKRMENSMEHKTTVGMGICPEVEELFDKGYVALIEVDSAKSGSGNDKKLSPKDAYRTGNIAYLKRDVLKELFTVPLEDSQNIVYIDEKTFQHLVELEKRAE